MIKTACSYYQFRPVDRMYFPTETRPKVTTSRDTDYTVELIPSALAYFQNLLTAERLVPISKMSASTTNTTSTSSTTNTSSSCTSTTSQPHLQSREQRSPIEIATAATQVVASFASELVTSQSAR